MNTPWDIRENVGGTAEKNFLQPTTTLYLMKKPSNKLADERFAYRKLFDFT